MPRSPARPGPLATPAALFRALFVEGLAGTTARGGETAHPACKSASPAALQSWVDETIDALFAPRER